MPEQDQGVVPPDTLLRGITLAFNRSAAQQADLLALLSAQQNPGSPLFHQWLTPGQFAARFGVAEADLAAAQAWLRSQGFTVDAISGSRDRITFSGTAQQVGEAFGTALHRYQMGQGTHIAPESAISLPAALAPLVSHVGHLTDLRPLSNVQVQEAPREANSPLTPRYTTTAAQAHYLSPKDIATLYDVTPLYSRSLNGAGQAIAIVGQSFIQTTAAQAFAQFTGAQNVPSLVLVPNSGTEAISYRDEAESDLDVEYAGAMAPAAQVFLVYTGSNPNYDAFDALAYAIGEDIAPVISVSYSQCEPLLSTTFLNESNSLFEQAAVQGQTIVAAAGDSGSTACAANPVSSMLSATVQQAPSVNFPGDNPLVLSVGGTQMTPAAFASGANSSWASAGSGTDLVASLLQYVPEVVWNEDSATGGISAGGGGASTVYTRPAWQTALPGIPSGTTRLVPDLALQASVHNPGFVFCTDDPTYLGTLTDCTGGNLDRSSGTPLIGGGTSFSAPIVAGMLAVLNQAIHSPGQGLVAPTLYGLAANGSTYAAVFHDVTSGSNACTAGANFCSAAGTAGYGATAGFDEASGLGSVNLNALVSAWPTGAATSATVPTSVQLATVGAFLPGVPTVTVSIQVSPLAMNGVTPQETPTGTVEIAVDGTVVQAAAALTALPGSHDATATYTFPTPASFGSHVITAMYSGDAQNLQSKGALPLNVGFMSPSGTFTLSATSITIANGSTGSTNVTVTPNGGYTGSVVWSLSVSGSVPTCYYLSSLKVNGPSTGQVLLGVGSACNVAQLRSTANPGKGHDPGAPLERHRRWPLERSGTLALASLLGIGLSTRRRVRWLPRLTALLLGLGLLGTLGCGGGKGNTASTTSVSTSNVLTVTLRGTDSVNQTISAATTFTLTVP